MADRPSAKTTIHGHTVYYDDEHKEAVKYLKYDLDPNEAEVFFRSAKEHRSKGADFEIERNDADFTLWYNNGAYEIREQEAPKGWF